MKQFWEQISQKGLLKKYRFALLILLLGVVLMLLPTSGKNEEVSRSDQEYETFSLEETERRMEEILGRIEGTGKLQLMLTLKSGSQLQLAEGYFERGAPMLAEPDRNAEERGIFRNGHNDMIIGVCGDEWYIVLREDGTAGYVPQSAFWAGNG